MIEIVRLCWRSWRAGGEHVQPSYCQTRSDLMSHGDTILVIIDPAARHHAALAKGALLAKRYRARMDLFGWEAVGTGACATESKFALKLQSLAHSLRANGLVVDTQLVPVESLDWALAERLKDDRARFVIKDVLQAGSAEPAELTAIDWALTRACHAPLLLSKPRLWPELPHICVAIDPDRQDQPWASSGDAVMEGTLLARRLDGELHLVYGHAPPGFVLSGQGGDLEAVKLSKEQATDHYVAQLRTSVLRMPGSVVVMSAGQQHRGVLLRRSPCDVLLVRKAQAPLSFH